MSEIDPSTGISQQGTHVVRRPHPGDRFARALTASYALDDLLPDDWTALIEQLDTVTRCPQQRTDDHAAGGSAPRHHP